MRIRTTVSFVALALCSFSSPSCHAFPFGPSVAGAAPDAQLAPPVIPVVVFGRNARRLPGAFAAEHALKEADLVRAHEASGLIHCGNAHGAGQLTLADDVVTTAAHVFFDENGVPRAPSCTFDITVDGAEMSVPINLSTIAAGSTKPYDEAVTSDWAVARLVHPVAGVKPYALAQDIHSDEAVTFVARGHIDWGEAKKLSMQACTLHDKLSDGTQGTREFSFDCDTGDGASGGALMFDASMSRVGAILVGWRSNRPFRAMPFSAMHYNFAVTMEGAFRQAIYAAAGGKLIVQK